MVCSIARFIVRRKLARFDKLLGNVFGHQLGHQLRPADLFDLDVDPPAGQVLQLVLQFLDLLPFAADQHAGPGRVNRTTFTSSRVRSISTFGIPACTCDPSLSR